jgi:enoyl-CoA hydratase/3-hydroxyacyl-CoA dehydrogenase
MAVPVVKVIWLDNPPVNAITTEMLEHVERTLAGLDESVGVVILRGRGERAFSVGADVTDFTDDSPRLAAAIQRTAAAIEDAPVPVLAAIQGYCLGGGLELALACDMRFCTEDSKFGFPEIRLGLIPGGGGTQRAPRLIGPGRAMSMMMSGDQVPAPKAQLWGLVEYVVDTLDEGVEQFGGGLAGLSPHALRELRQLLRETRGAPDYERELEAFARCLASDDGREGIAAFLEKREPRWSGR